MKYLNKLSVLTLAALAFAACDDLDTDYKGGYVTSEGKEGTLERNPEMAQAGVAGISSLFSTYMTTYSNHFDFGYAGVMLGLDQQTDDMVCGYNGYNWFRYWSSFTSPTPSGTPAGMAWYHIYDQIFACNATASSISADTEDPTLRFYRAQATAARAFDYFVLAQLFQFNYQINPQLPAVPLILDTNAAEIEEHGAPRATLEEVYTQVLADINEAISLLSNTNVTPEQVIDTKPKRFVSLATAYGLRARIYLTMGKYAEAVADAESAIANFSGSPYTIKELGRPGLTSLEDHSWMWGIAIAETDRVVTSGIVNWPSMIVSFCDGYVNYGAWKYCASDLYASISKTDVRKGWWLDEEMSSPILSTTQAAYLSQYADELPVYTNVKFGSYNDVMGTSTNANDIMLMRIEEMYYIKAEAMARGGNATGAKEFFENFIKTYRNPNYVMQGSTADEVAEAIYQDKRVEFWGEGIAWFDVMRLNRSIDHTGKNWDKEQAFKIPSYYEDETADKQKARVLIYCIPQGEINGNPMISASDNNPSGTRPMPGQ